MRRLMNVLMLSCKKATELFERKQETGLSRVQNVQLHLHTSMCSACTAYQKQSKQLGKTLTHFIKEDKQSADSLSLSASSEVKERIIKGLSESQG